MTEAEWLDNSGEHLDRMLDLVEYDLKIATSRKRILFAVACCRRIWHLLVDERSRSCVEAAEWLADSHISAEEYEEFREAAEDAREVLFGHVEKNRRMKFAFLTGPGSPFVLAHAALAAVHHDSRNSADIAGETETWEMGEAVDRLSPYRLSHVALLRDIFGNPFRVPLIGTTSPIANVTALANGVYQDRAFDRLPILADALEDAGCTPGHPRPLPATRRARARLLGRRSGSGEEMKGTPCDAQAGERKNTAGARFDLR